MGVGVFRHALLRRCTKNSRLPSAPTIGDGASATGLNPIRSAADRTSSTTRLCTAASVTTPRLPTSARPASNCGLTSATTSPSGLSSGGSGASTSLREMNETSTVTTSTGWNAGGRDVRSSPRALTPSMTVTRGSWRSFHASWPRPTSSAATRAAPRRNNTSVKPPVDAPTSRAVRPATTTPSASSACASLTPPRLTYGWSAAAKATLASSGTAVPAFDTVAPSTRTCPASTSARARARVGASPRSTTSASSLTRRDIMRRFREPNGSASWSWRAPSRRFRRGARRAARPPAAPAARRQWRARPARTTVRAPRWTDT